MCDLFHRINEKIILKSTLGTSNETIKLESLVGGITTIVKQNVNTTTSNGDINLTSILGNINIRIILQSI